MSPRLNDQTLACKRARVLQRSQTTARGKDAQLDNDQQLAQGYYKLHMCGEGRINHDVPSYGRSHIGVEDKQRKDVPEQIGDSGDKCKRDSPHNSGQEDGTKSVTFGLGRDKRRLKRLL